jgi:hypothetical protein
MIENIIEHKYYIGVRTCKNILPSKDLGIKYFSSSLNKDFKRHQKQNPSQYRYHVLEIFNNRKDANAFEIELHIRYDVAVNESFYNRATATSTGFSIDGRSHTPESRAKISASHKGIKKSPEHCANISAATKGEKNPNFGKIAKEETRLKMSVSRKGVKRSPESVEKTAASKRGKPRSEETKAKISAAHKGVPKSKESIEKMKATKAANRADK